MPSRRDFIRTIILSSGAVYSGMASGCGERGRTPALQKDAQASEHFFGKRTIKPGAQFYELAHKYIRNSSPAAQAISETVECDVAIVGSGAAGLTAAMHLMKQGYSVLILENELRAGGAAVSGSYKQTRFPLASIYFVDYNDQIKELCTYAGVTPTPAPPDALMYKGQHYTEYWDDGVLDTLPLAKDEISELRRFRDVILNMKELPSYPLSNRLSARDAELDAMTVRDYCSQYKSPFLLDIARLYTRSSMGGTPEETNAYCFLNFYAAEIQKEAKTPRYTFAGGLNGLTAAVAAKIGNDHFKYGYLSYHVRNTATGAEVYCLNREEKVACIRAKQVIMATQKYMTPHIIPEMPDAQKQAIRKIGYSPYLTVHLCSRRSILAKHDFDTWFVEADPLFTDIIDPLSITPDAKPEGYVASVYCPRPIGERSALQSDEVIASTCRKVAEKVDSLLGNNTLDAIEEIQAFAWGHSIVIPAPGSHNGIAQAAARSVGNIHFAHTDNDCAPALENAVANGTRAAEVIISRMKGVKGR